MNPVTGPFVKEIGAITTGPSSFYDYKRGYRQAKPFNLPLSYAHETSSILFMSGIDAPGYNPFTNAFYNGTYNGVHCNFRALTSASVVTTPVAQAKSQCFEKIVNQLDDKVELLVSLAERRETLEMMEKRVVDLYRFTKALRHPSPDRMRQFFTGTQLPQKARETLAYYLKNWRQVAKGLGNAWLEFHFGWEPLVKDIDTCLQLLSRPLSEASVHVYSRKLRWKYAGVVESYDKQTRTQGFAEGTVRAACTCTVSVDNPKKAYQSILGLNNLPLVGYSLIPFSWMFDWVNYMGSWISQMSDLSGYRIINASNSYKVRAIGWSQFNYPKDTIKKKNAYSGVLFLREIGIPSVSLTWRPLPARASWSRALTSISLLTGGLASNFDLNKMSREMRLGTK